MPKQGADVQSLTDVDSNKVLNCIELFLIKYICMQVALHAQRVVNSADSVADQSPTSTPEINTESQITSTEDGLTVNQENNLPLDQPLSSQLAMEMKDPKEIREIKVILEVYFHVSFVIFCEIYNIDCTYYTFGSNISVIHCSCFYHN